MTFARPLAIHNILIPGGTFTMPHRMAALYEQVWKAGGSSTLYEASLENEIVTASPGPGSYSFLLKRTGQPNATQYNFRNVGTQAAPSDTDCYIAINPDGDVDPVVNSLTGLNGSAAVPANQNGALGRASFVVGVNNSSVLAYYSRLLVFEFDDAIAIVGHDGTTYSSDVFHAGSIIAPRWAEDIDGGGIYDTRVGIAAVGGVTRSVAVATRPPMWNSATTTTSCVRLGLGNTIGATPNASWTTLSLFPLFDNTVWTANNYFQNFGPSSVNRAAPYPATFYRGAHLGYFKYLKRMGQTQTPSQIYKKGADNYLVFLQYVASSGTVSMPYMWMHTTKNYDPVSLGTFTDP